MGKLGRLQRKMRCSLLFVALAASANGIAVAQGGDDVGDAGSCVLKNHVYTCNGAEFEVALAHARTVEIEAHNSDGVARNQLTALVNKLGKTVAERGSAPDLVFLMIPIEPEGVVNNFDTVLGTLRIYSATPDGARGRLLWAETYSGAQDIPWQMVAHALVRQFEAHFKIK
jgi:hypothetical protein